MPSSYPRPTTRDRLTAAVPATVSTGILLMLVSQLLVMPTSDAIVKHLVVTLPAVQLAWARFFFNFLLLAPAAFWLHRRCALAPARPGLQVLRGALVVAANLLFIAGVRVVPLADALAVTFVAPLVVAVLSPVVLRERVGPAALGAAALGFLGALVIIRPGVTGFSPATLLPLGAGLAFGSYLLVTRKLAGTTPPLVTQTATAATGAVLTTALLPFAWTSPTAPEFALMATIGVMSCVGHLLITVAHEHARAATLAPLTYLSIVSAAGLGYLLFGDWPDALTWLGAATIIASGLVVWWRSGRP